MKKLLIGGVIATLLLCTGCETMINRAVEQTALSNMQEKPIHDVFYISPATRAGDTVYRWYNSYELGSTDGSWIEVLEVKGPEYHLASYPAGDAFPHQVHYWVENHHVKRAELHYGNDVFPLKVEPARKGGMYTSFESIVLNVPQELVMGRKTFKVNRIETLNVEDTTTSVGTTVGTEYKTIRYISDDVPLGIVKEEAYFTSQVLRDNWEYVSIGLKALDPTRSRADTLMSLLRTFREKEKTNLQMVFYQEPRKMVDPKE